MALKLGKQTYQILTNNDEFCIPSLSSILLAVKVSLLIALKNEWTLHDNNFHGNFLMYKKGSEGNDNKEEI